MPQWYCVDSSSLGEIFKDGPLAIFRLSLEDYHRFHSPVSGEIIERKTLGDVDDTLLSVNHDVFDTGNGAIYNFRKILIIQTPSMSKQFVFEE